jgi:acyl-CoA thioester hydrolase
MKIGNEKYCVSINFSIKTYEIDAAGHVNNIVYLKWFEILRTKLFKDYFNLKFLLSTNLYPVVISANINYKKYLKLFDEPSGFVNLVSNDHGIIKLKFEIRINGKIAASGEQRCVLMDLISGKMVKDKLDTLEIHSSKIY